MQYMVAKRNNPSLTMGEAEEMTITQLSELSGMDMSDPKEVTSA
jgi:hypothetical protein